MSPDVFSADTLLQPAWHSIRPWTPPLSLNVREITSVSATFILSSSLSDSEHDPSLAALGLSTADDDEDKDQLGEDSRRPKSQSIISDALAKGLSVNVNGSPWQRVFIRIEDKVDEAVIIIYGLMPGRHYDIDLAIVQGGQTNNLKRQVTTEDSDVENSEIHTDPESPDFEHSNSSDALQSTPSTSPSRTTPGTPPSVPQITFEERLNQMQHSLSTVEAERDSLIISLKTARRDAQKADAALRSEIDILKRASEKNSIAEHRTKQKILALQEAVKRAQIATRDTEETVTIVESEVPVLNEKKTEKELGYAQIKEQADRVRGEREREDEKERKKMETTRAELASLNSRLEKLNMKKEKLETGAIPDLEEQLREVEQEIEAETQQTGMFEADELYPNGGDSPNSTFLQPRPRQPSLTRPTLPIQRPPHSEIGSLSGIFNQPWNFMPSRQAPSANHNARASSLTQQTPSTIPSSNPPRRLSLKSNPSSSPSLTPATSTLSSRAPAFEPGRPLKNNTSVSTSTSGFPTSPVFAQHVPRSSSGNIKTSPHWTNVQGQTQDGGWPG